MSYQTVFVSIESDDKQKRKWIFSKTRFVSILQLESKLNFKEDNL